ncbi:hypothetical protein [Enterococcus mundtii]|uniref:hypothetical protein n=1 Tax=Enterococcus mundtii TaxID=53346 RepID=UPI00321A61EB
MALWKLKKYEKLFSDFSSYCSGQSASFTTWINGVRKPAPSILRQQLKKYEKLFSQLLP